MTNKFINDTKFKHRIDNNHYSTLIYVVDDLFPFNSKRDNV